MTTNDQVAMWISWLQNKDPSLVDSLRQCSHHYDHEHLNPWHLEGDIWSHTMLVLNSYARLGIDDVCVGLTALLHDIGKPKAVRALHDRHRKVFQGHESQSAWMAWELLKDEALALTNQQRLRIFSLIALHGALYSGWFGKGESLNVAQVAQAFSGFDERFWQQLLAQIANDTAGQICTQNNQKQGLSFLSELILKTPQPTEQTNKIPLILLVGLPGSGKSTHREQYSEPYTIISRDDLMLEMTGTQHYRQAWQIQQEHNLSDTIDQALNHRYTLALNAHQPLVIDMTNLTRKARKKWLSQCPTTHYHRQCKIFIASEKTIWQRNFDRNIDRRLPNDVLAKMMLSFEHPLFDEFDQIDFITEGA